MAFDDMKKIAAILIILVSFTHFVFAETTIVEGPAKITIPDRFTIEKKTVSDEGEIGGMIVDSKTAFKIRFWINDLNEPKGLHPTKVDWQKVLFFERSPAGWYDRQLFVFEEDKTLRIEARYAFQRCMFQSSIPKGQDYHVCIDVLKLLVVELNPDWKLIRGTTFDSFKVFPKEAAERVPP